MRFTERSHGRSPTSRSGRATWRCPSTVPTPSPPRTSTRPPSRLAARGATAAAAELSELAADLTPGDPALERQRRLRAAKSHRLAGDGARAVLLLDRILTEVPEGLERSDVLFELASTLKADPQTTIERLDEALTNADEDEMRQARILGYRGWIRVFQAEIDAALVDTRAALEKAERMGDPELIAVMIGHVAIAEGRAGDFTPGLVERGVEIEQRLGLQLQYNESPSMSLSRRLAGQGELDRARALLDEIGTKAAARGDERLRAQVRAAHARIEWFAGNWQLALDLANEAHELHPRIQHEVGFIVRLRALAEADLGLVEQARASAEAGSDDGRGDVRQGVGDPERGRSGAARVRARRSRRGSGLRARAARRAPLEGVQGSDGSRLGRRDRDPHRRRRARAGERPISTQYEVNSSRAGSPWAVAVAARCRGLLAAAEDDLAAALTAFERSLAELEGLPYPFERGRTLLCLGTVRRQAQQRKAAREALEEALAIFEELGARLWAEKARAELARISGRRTTSDELTGTERRVAELAASGHTNKEIAAELFMGVSTVEAHLSRIYRKLGLRSRTELAGRISTARGETVKTGDERAEV